jgi:hypothetical protein
LIATAEGLETEGREPQKKKDRWALRGELTSAGAALVCIRADAHGYDIGSFP